MFYLRSEEDVEVGTPLGFTSEHHGSLGSCTPVVTCLSAYPFIVSPGIAPGLWRHPVCKTDSFSEERSW